MTRKLLVIGIIVFLLIVLSALIAGVYSYRAFFSPLNKTDETARTFAVEAGEGAAQIALNLKKAGLIKSAFNFETWVWLKKAEKSFQVGEYSLNPSLDVRQVVNLLTANTGDNEITIKILEGWTINDIGAYLENQNWFTAKELMKVAGYPPTVSQSQRPGQDFSSEYDFLKDKSGQVGLEGYLFPDTYRIFNNASTEDVVRKLLTNFDRKLTAEMRSDIAKNNMTVFDTIILASILEKEMKTTEDKRKAASVFYKRLNAGMALQADSTVNYVTGKKVSSLDQNDLQTESAYNTYRHRGLPPGPICNPGLDAIKAAIYPDKNDYWYFLTDNQGQAYFAKTLEEHGDNRIKYLNK
ncbi:MAG: endolytic transglycosylase MltG [bacterium]